METTKTSVRYPQIEVQLLIEARDNEDPKVTLFSKETEITMKGNCLSNL